MNIVAKDGDAGGRLDVFISKALTDLSRSRIQALMYAGSITVNGQVMDPHTRVRAGMSIEVQMPPPAPPKLEPENIPLSIIHEDSDLIVIDKPAGMVVHPSAGCYTGTLANALLHHCHDLAGVGGELRPGIVHRLDKDTSGILVVAKNDRSMHSLSNQFRTRAVHKEYLAIAYGIPNPPTGRIDAPIGRHLYNRKRMSVRETPKNRDPSREPLTGGRPAITEYALEEAFTLASLLRLVIKTGRTHQIRVHLSHLGHPVVGDTMYGGRRQPFRLLELLQFAGLVAAPTPGGAAPDPAAEPLLLPIRRQMLHAETLEFTHPSLRERMRFHCPPPADMVLLLTALRQTRTVQNPTPAAPTTPRQ